MNIEVVVIFILVVVVVVIFTGFVVVLDVFVVVVTGFVNNAENVSYHGPRICTNKNGWWFRVVAF